MTKDKHAIIDNEAARDLVETNDVGETIMGFKS